MPQIHLLSQETIDKIAAGEVIERPSSVVKELVENAIDAQATAITVEIKEGGTSLIRITDNGCGIPADQVKIAFLRHSTSKISSALDLMNVSSLGFRGEALSSISAVSRVELITKTANELCGVRYQIEGSKEIGLEEIGAPDGTTFLVKDLFYNTPARKKFLKTPQTEAAYISDVVEHLALSHPDITFKFINNNQTKLHTSGNGNRKDLIYHIFGREIASALLEVDYECEFFHVSGYIGKPVITRGNRNYENYFINGRYIKSSLLSKAIEEGYKNFLMQHQYPFTVLYFTFDQSTLDVNVHPSKMELRFDHNQEIYKQLYDVIYGALAHRNLIPDVPVEEQKEKREERVYKDPIPEPFEKRRIQEIRNAITKDSPYELRYPERFHQQPKPQNVQAGGLQNMQTTAGQPPTAQSMQQTSTQSGQQEAMQTGQTGQQIKHPGVINITHGAHVVREDIFTSGLMPQTQENAVEQAQAPQSQEYAAAEQLSVLQGQEHTGQEASIPAQGSGQQAAQKESEAVQEQYEEITLSSISPDFMTQAAKKEHRIIGQLFDTYWLIEYDEKLYIIDQHAAHEKVLYERTMARLREKDYTSQILSPPLILSLDAKEQEALERFREPIEKLGYEVEHFGGKEYMINAIPGNLFNLDMKDLFIEMLDDFSNMSGRETPELILEKVASMSCKAAVKGNNRLSLPEIQSLIDELLTLDNPYNCPHGRPTIISMTKYELEKKFKRII